MRFRRLFLWGLGGILLLIGAAYFVFDAQQETVELSEGIRSQVPGKLVSLRGGVTHYYFEGGDSSDLTVFIHGGGITGLEVWENNIPFFLNNSYQVLAYDLYGRGYSDRPKVAYTPEFFTSQFTELLDTLSIRKPFNIVAMSMGAIIALDYASRHPMMVKKIVLLDPAATGEFTPSFLLKLPVVNRLLMTMYWYPNAVENQRKEFVNQELFDQYRERLRYFMNFRGYKYVNFSTWMHTLGQSRVHLLASIKPDSILMLYGERDPYFPAGNVSVYTLHYPSLEHRMIEGAGHMPNFEKPDVVNTLIHAYLSD